MHNSNNPIVPYISLCSGYEGIGIGLHGQVGYPHKGKLNSRWVETLMNLPVGWCMPSCKDLDSPEYHTKIDNRTDELRLLGNGVVPATAEKAFVTLMRKMVEKQS